MEVAHSTVLDTKSGAFLENCVYQTQKEVQYVHQTAEPNADLFLRRLKHQWENSRSAGNTGSSGVSSLGEIKTRLNQAGVWALHQGIVFHALSVQLYTFSGGEINDPTLHTPLWLSLMLKGHGLRRMTPDTSRHATRLFHRLGLPAAEELGRAFVTDPRKAYRLGLFQLAGELGRQDENPAELELRLRLATQSFAEVPLSEVERIAGANDLMKISLLSSATAYAAKQGKAPPVDILDTLNEWLDRRYKNECAEDPRLVAQVLNAINLVHLVQGEFAKIEDNMDFLLRKITPRIPDLECRAHIEGNAAYQKSILMKKRSFFDSEVDALISAMTLDRNFGALYYRMAQRFHDQGDSRAEPFYEMALALSPIDLPSANDYGCLLMDLGRSEKFASWKALCKILFPKEFEGAQGEMA